MCKQMFRPNMELTLLITQKSSQLLFSFNADIIVQEIWSDEAEYSA